MTRIALLGTGSRGSAFSSVPGDQSASVDCVAGVGDLVAAGRVIDELAQRHDIDTPITRTLVGVVDPGVTLEEAAGFPLVRSVMPE